MKEAVLFFEIEGGDDKGTDGHRKDTMPMIEALRAKGWTANSVFYRPDRVDELYSMASRGFGGYVSRVNPGKIPGGDQTYYDLLRRLSDNGLVGMSHPDTMITFGSKDSLCKLSGSALVPEDTYCYFTVDDMRQRFPASIAAGERVIKQNRGSTGSGIWHVRCVDERDFSGLEALPLDAQMRCVEAADNHVEEMLLDEFISFCGQYFADDAGLVVDMRFLPRIKEGELRILMVGNHPVFVVHKVPVDSADAFSATLFSGAKYTYDDPAKWPVVVDLVTSEMPHITSMLGVDEIPLIWTADIILDDAPDGGDAYVLGEINCSCVGFTSHLDMGIQDLVADEIIRQMTCRAPKKMAPRPIRDTVTAAFGLIENNNRIKSQPN
jgi:hypothetical protein